MSAGSPKYLSCLRSMGWCSRQMMVQLELIHIHFSAHSEAQVIGNVLQFIHHDIVFSSQEEQWWWTHSFSSARFA